jgi:hypothetical protein
MWISLLITALVNLITIMLMYNILKSGIVNITVLMGHRYRVQGGRVINGEQDQ